MSASTGIWPLRRSATWHASEANAGPRLVLCAASFNLILCFVNTRHWATIGNGGIILVEFFILLTGFWCVRHRISTASLQFMLLLVLCLLGIKFINPGLDLKILHDLSIMYVFYKLGTLSSIEQGNRTLWIVMLIVLGVGAWEFLLPDLFVKIFDIWSYYTNKGVIPQGTINYAQSNFFISGNRGNGVTRNFFPSIFGSHRISSIFLEPDSLGNFAVITFAWCLSTATGSRRSRVLLFALSVLCIVLADSRFAFICCGLMLVLRQSAFVRSNIFIFLAPVTVMAALTLAGLLKPMPLPGLTFIVADDFAGRLLFSGRLLDDWGWAQWFGLSVSQVYTADTGYAYFINNLGFPLAFILLLRFVMNPDLSREAAWMKGMMSIYFAASLCVGSSVFTIKTAALLWFLYGASNAAARGKQWLGPPDPATKLPEQNLAMPLMQLRH
jgi:putative polymerase